MGDWFALSFGGLVCGAVVVEGCTEAVAVVVACVSAGRVRSSACPTAGVVCGFAGFVHVWAGPRRVAERFVGIYGFDAGLRWFG